MRKITFWGILATALFTVSCNSDSLDIENKNLLTNEDVFSNHAAVKANIATLYASAPMQDFNFNKGKFDEFPSDANHNPMGWVGEAHPNSVYTGKNMDASWGMCYRNIREINTFLQALSLSDMEENEKEVYEAEARFLRGYAYFFLVRAFGGVPLLDYAMPWKGELDPLMVPRNKEIEVWDFVLSDFDFAAKHLSSEKEYGRANRFVALAYKSKAALYAASIGRYLIYDEEVDKDYHCVGVPESRVEGLYQIALNAAKQVIDEGGYALYRNFGKTSKNFQYLFLNTVDNPEVIWAEGFDYSITHSTHSHDCMILPRQLSITYGKRMAPYLETAERFEFRDGRETTPLANNSRFARLEDIFADRDLRLRGTIVMPNDIVKKTQIDILNGVLINGQFKQGNVSGMYFDTVTKAFTKVANENTIKGTGLSGGAGIEGTTTGMHCKKYLDETLPQSRCQPWQSESDYILMRYADVLLNYVEAAVELGTNQMEALSHINDIRDRAGLIPLDITQLTRDRVRNERQSEFTLEPQLFWDIRRWHIFKKHFQSTLRSMMQIFYDIETGEYVVRRKKKASFSYTTERLYYNQIPMGELSKNPKLVNNPMY